MPTQWENRRRRAKRDAQDLKNFLPEEPLNEIDPTVKKCARGLHVYDGLKHGQCPECRKTTKQSNRGPDSPNLSPVKLYNKLWRTMVRDAHAMEDMTRQGKKLNHMQSKQLLEYLKFLQDVKALEELEQIEEKAHGKTRTTAGRGSRKKPDDAELQSPEGEASDDGDGDSEPSEGRL
jgi:hypothetical protein